MLDIYRCYSPSTSLRNPRDAAGLRASEVSSGALIHPLRLIARVLTQSHSTSGHRYRLRTCPCRDSRAIDGYGHAPRSCGGLDVYDGHEPRSWRRVSVRRSLRLDGARISTSLATVALPVASLVVGCTLRLLPREVSIVRTDTLYVGSERVLISVVS